MTDDPIVAALAAKLDGPAETADADAEPAAVPTWPRLGQGARGTPFSKPHDPLLDEVLDKLGLPPQYQLGRGDR